MSSARIWSASLICREEGRFGGRSLAIKSCRRLPPATVCRDPRLPATTLHVEVNQHGVLALCVRVCADGTQGFSTMLSRRELERATAR